MGREPLLLIHSGVGAASEWDAVRALLDPGREVIAPDLIGHGEQPVPDRPGWSQAHRLRDMLDGPATICGASFGGLVAMQLAALAPELVSRLVLLAPALPEWEWSERTQAYGAREEELVEAGDLDAAVELNVATWLGPDPDPGHAELVRANQRRAFELQLAPDAADPAEDPVEPAAITAATTVLAGAEDLPDFVAIARHLAATITGARLELLEGARHLLALEHPDVVADAVA